jgi:hypothetical protein
VTDRKTNVQVLRALVQQQNRENVVVDDAANDGRHAFEQRVEVERSVHHVGHFQQERLDFRQLRRHTHRHLRGLGHPSS